MTDDNTTDIVPELLRSLRDEIQEVRIQVEANGARIDRNSSRIDVLVEEMMRGFTVVAERLHGVDGRLNGIDGRLEGIDGRLSGIDGRLDRMEGHLHNLHGSHADRLGMLEQVIDSLKPRVEP